MRTKHSGSCFTTSSYFTKACIENSCVIGAFTTLKVPSKYQVLAFASSSNCESVARITCFWSFTVTVPL
ncbi:hypothetical protein DPMN_072955 [Dreissena polymorpha]|uniref:Uncharacterized protein n=1 Tax=Dreissena polymorpha TaxID=45954 RepID=A0A9D4BY59_DREPO|nr:hypothetical protein DPMN_072955 [Dreissena polymorpha]